MQYETENTGLTMARRTLHGAYLNWQKKDKGYRVCAKCHKPVDIGLMVTREFDSGHGTKRLNYHRECYQNMKPVHGGRLISDGTN